MSDTRRRAEPATPELRSLFDRIYAANKTNADLGRLLGLDGSQVTRIIKGTRQIQRHEWKRIEEWLGSAIPESHETGEVTVMPGLVPLYGWAGAASDERLTFAEQTLIGAVPRHPNQQNARGAFALRVSDESMAPRYEPGETVYVAPNQWPAREQDCVLVTHEGYGYLKRFVRRFDGVVTVRQLNPESELTFPVDDIAAMHAVVGRG
ncbi:helix-turn-helix transcriptional regulator [Brevundimonas faecalis]|uniref:S24 family peptidase n=1 Tax=Brevundimonas faecalis TaxID=947378 RepID=UPI00361FC93C